jgi:hypothetical protein
MSRLTPRGTLMDAAAVTLSPGALRARRYRNRKKEGVRCVCIRMSEPAIKALVEGGFLAAGPCQDADVERAIYGLLNAARAAGVRRL